VEQHLGPPLPVVTGARGPRRITIGRHHRQPDGQVGRKRGSKAQVSTPNAPDAVGYDAGKKLKGRKIQALVDTLGLPIRLVVRSAGIQDRDGAALIFDTIKRRFPWLECVFADTGYNAQQTYEAACDGSLRLEIVRRNPNAVGFEVIKNAGLWSGPSPGSVETDASPRFSRTSLPPCWPSSPWPPSSSESGDSRDRRLLSQAPSTTLADRRRQLLLGASYNAGIALAAVVRRD
jgi:Transposase DDE domain